MPKFARNYAYISLTYLQMILAGEKYEKNGRQWPYWILRNLTICQKIVSVKVVPIDLKDSNPTAVALPLEMYTNI